MTSIFFIDGLGSLDTQNRVSSTIHANHGWDILRLVKQLVGSLVRFRSCSKPRKADMALAVLAILSLLFGFAVAAAVRRFRTVDHAAGRALVRELGLTDLSLFTEVRYTRHLSQADRHAAFQDHPAALEYLLPHRFAAGASALPRLLSRLSGGAAAISERFTGQLRQGGQAGRPLHFSGISAVRRGLSTR